MRRPVARCPFDERAARRYILGAMSTPLPLQSIPVTRRTVRVVILGFVAGVLGVLIFHQGVVLAMYLLDLLPSPPYSMRATAPLGIPQVLSSAFWGGLWGIVLVWCMMAVRGADRLWVALLFGGVLPTLVGILVVTPLKGGDPMARLQIAGLLRGFVINGAWGLGTALAYRLANRWRL
jgi:hypothetical protein